MLSPPPPKKKHQKGLPHYWVSDAEIPSSLENSPKLPFACLLVPMFCMRAQDSFSILTTTACFLLHDLNCKQQNLKNKGSGLCNSEEIGGQCQGPQK